MSILTNKNNEKIAFFDSGVGGLTVYAKFRKLLNTENCIYFGDLKHLPYGNKSKDELIGYSRAIFDFFKQQNVKAVVMACNTSSAAAYSTVKDEYDFKIYPMIQSCAKIIAEQNYSRLGIFATEATINSGVYEAQIHKYNPHIKTFTQSCPQWVNIVENHTFGDVQMIEIIKSDLEKMLKNEPDKIILGCTHYPYLLNVLSSYTGADIYIDPAHYFVEYIKSDLEKSCMLNTQKIRGSEEFYVSANPDDFILASKMFYDVPSAEVIELHRRISV
ncbi:MAG: glutamate racemase [Candidatus Gastranaerophilales bacterium]|nr:glutamate racemase [Candidatus Gastranaerophilales bacterium]